MSLNDIYIAGRALAPGKPTTLFIHGAGLDHTVWASTVQHFAGAGHSVAAIDLPGHGDSREKPLASIEAMADWILALLDALELDRAALVGHSLGSLVALDCAARYPQRVRALGLVGTSAPMPVSEELLDAAAANDPGAFKMLTEWGYADPDHPSLPQTLQIFRNSAPGVLHSDLQACNRYRQALERADQVRCPVVLVLGEWDRLTPVRNTGPLLEALGSPEVEIIPEVGHTLMEEAPEALRRALEQLL